jgi:hypothetical protein
MGNIKDIAGAVKFALAAAITFIRVHMDQINFKIDFFFRHIPQLFLMEAASEKTNLSSRQLKVNQNYLKFVVFLNPEVRIQETE